ncbi:hypothetical protein ABT023_19945 [Micromonospora sp. NPDC002296]
MPHPRTGETVRAYVAPAPGRPGDRGGTARTLRP